MDENWDASIDVTRCAEGWFSAVLVLVPPAEIGLPIRLPIDGKFADPELAEMAALDAFAAMTRG